MKNKKLSIEGAHIALSGGKKGMKVKTIDTFWVQPKYDDIFLGEFPGRNGGYILKTAINTACTFIGILTI